MRRTNVTATSAKLTHVHSRGGPIRISDKSMIAIPASARVRVGRRQTKALIVTAASAHTAERTLFQLHGKSLR